jgi:hypothetical protein
MRSSITQVRRRLTDGENPSPSYAAQDDIALCLNIFANDFPNYSKHAPDKLSPRKRAEIKLRIVFRRLSFNTLHKSRITIHSLP